MSSESAFYEPETLVDRLQGIYRIPIRDGLGPVGGSEEPNNSDEYVRTHETPRQHTPIMREAARRIKELEAHVAALIPLAQLGDACFESWPEGSIDGGDLQDMLKDHGLIAAVPGGFNENIHIDAYNCCPEEGDEWLMPTKAALAARDILAALERP